MREEDAHKYACFNAQFVACKGSLCMAWRWHVRKTIVHNRGTFNVPTAHGYFGLAGQPEADVDYKGEDK